MLSLSHLTNKDDRSVMFPLSPPQLVSLFSQFLVVKMKYPSRTTTTSSHLSH